MRWVMLGLAMVLVVACGGTATPTSLSELVAAGPQPGGTLTLSFGEDFVTLHPYLEVNHAAFKPLIYEAPVRITEDGGFEPWLATGWEIADDGLSLTLRLRPGVTFHNGRAVTADDWVWAITLASNQEAGHHLAGRFREVAAAVALDATTVRITYRTRTAGQLDALARLYLFPREAAATIDTAPVGTGPFKFVEWIPGDRVILERFDGYWQPGRPYLDGVTLVAVPDTRTRLTSLRMGTLDLLYGVPLSERVALAELPNMTVEAVPAGFAFYAFLMNINVPPFDRLQVRQAFHYAIDRDEIIAAAFAGQAQPATLPLPVTSWAYAPELADAYPHDPARAHVLLAAAGYPAGFSIQMLVREESGPYLEQARVLRRQMAVLGVEIQLVPEPLGEYWPRLFAGDFALVSHKTGGAGVDPGVLFEEAACCRTERSFFGIQDRSDEWFIEYVDVIEQARAEMDQSARARLYRRALAIWQEQAWTIPTVWDQPLVAYWNTLQDVRIDMEGALWLHDAWLVAQ